MFVKCPLVLVCPQLSLISHQSPWCFIVPVWPHLTSCAPWIPLVRFSYNPFSEFRLSSRPLLSSRFASCLIWPHLSSFTPNFVLFSSNGFILFPSTLLRWPRLSSIVLIPPTYFVFLNWPQRGYLVFPVHMSSGGLRCTCAFLSTLPHVH